MGDCSPPLRSLDYSSCVCAVDVKIPSVRGRPFLANSQACQRFEVWATNTAP